ncbi:MAG: hypothetical protein PVJ84_18510 [Desulfobacteraceae bacterium]|jgi:hypothetical protein
MFPSGARAILTKQFFTAALCLISSFIAATAHCDPYSVRMDTERHNCIDKQINNVNCSGLAAGTSFSGIRSDLQYSRYLNTPLTLHDSFSAKADDNRVPSANFLALFKLALEEFNLLSGVRIYWEYTERNIEQWAVKLKLKGEIAITDPYDNADGRTLQNAKRSKMRGSRPRSVSHGLRSLFLPQTIRWNLGLNPEDGALFADLHLNPYLSLSGRFSDESQAGLYFRYAF